MDTVRTAWTGETWMAGATAPLAPKTCDIAEMVAKRWATEPKRIKQAYMAYEAETWPQRDPAPQIPPTRSMFSPDSCELFIEQFPARASDPANVRDNMARYPECAHLLTVAYSIPALERLPPWRLPGAFSDFQYGDVQLMDTTAEEVAQHVEAIRQECEADKHRRHFEEVIAAERILEEHENRQKDREERRRKTGVKVRKDKKLWTKLRKTTRH